MSKKIIFVLFCSVFVSVGLYADESKPDLTQRWAQINISGPYPEGPQIAGLFGEVTETLDQLTGRLNKAAEDKRLSGVLLVLSGANISWSQLNEIQRAIAKIRNNDKKVYAWMSTASSMDYLIASSSDKMFMPESASLMLLGLRAEVNFYKNMFDKLDIEADILRVGKYKSAAEPFSRSQMSPEFREEIESVLDDYFDQMVEMIANYREISQEKVETAINTGPHMAASARELGLIDDVLYRDQIKSYISKHHGPVKVDYLVRYGKQTTDHDFSGFAGMVKLMEMITGNTKGKGAVKGDSIAIIHANGTIVSGKSTGNGLSGGSSLGADTFIKAVNEAAENDQVKAVVLRINSPGGSALASDLMWHTLEQLDKPLVVSMGGVAASGGYYIAMGSDRIFAEPGTITGSIGVVGGKIALQGLMQKAGITTSVISRGDNSGSMSTLTGFSVSERRSMTRILEEIYRQFTQKAATGRNMDYDKLESLAQGRIYTGRMALENGLIDELGTLEDAIKHAKSIAGMAVDEPHNQIILPKPLSPFEQIFGSIDASANSHHNLVSALQSLLPGISEPLQLLSIIELMRHETTMTLMPFQIRIQ